jgi:type VI secretion system protein ImpG
MRGQGGVGHGTEVYLSLVDLGLDLKAPADWTVDVKTTCMNRDLPNELPFGGDALELQSAEGGPFASIRCVTKPTRTIRPDLGQGVAWKIISHLTLNHLSITDEPEALKDILRLYNHTRRPETESKIAGIHRLSSGSIVRPIPDVSPTGFARGVEVRLEFDESQYSDNGMFLFASVLEYFLGLYCSINSFTQLVISTRGKPDKRLKTWPPRAGRRILL